MSLKLAIIVSHPIQHFAPWHREVAKFPNIDLRVYFCCDWGLESYVDPEFQIPVAWDIPLTEGYEHEFLPIARRPERLGFLQVDNPSVGAALDRFKPDVVKVFGYAHRTNWRVARWARRKQKPLMIYSDSNVRSQPPWWKRGVKEAIVRYFYGHVDGALFVGDNNLAYHRHFGMPDERMFPGILPIDREYLLASVGNPSEARYSTRRQIGIPPEAFTIIWCGKFAAHKRPTDFVSAVHAAAKRGLPVWGVVVGEGEQRKEIEMFCQQEGVENVVLTGFINQSNLAKYYIAADAVAITSERDAHPLVVTEAASFRLPVIASDRIGCIGLNDTVRPGVNALVYACGNQEQLGNAIERLYQDRALYESMSQASLRISEQQDMTVAARQLSSAVERLHALGPR